jgi:hypothetical protein
MQETATEAWEAATKGIDLTQRGKVFELAHIQYLLRGCCQTNSNQSLLGQ